MTAPDPAVYAVLPTEQLRSLLDRPGMPAGHRQVAEQELARRAGSQAWSPVEPAGVTDQLPAEPATTAAYPQQPAAGYPAYPQQPAAGYPAHPTYPATAAEYPAAAGEYPGYPPRAAVRSGAPTKVVVAVCAAAAVLGLIVMVGIPLLLWTGSHRTLSAASAPGGASTAPGTAQPGQWVTDTNTYCRTVDLQLKQVGQAVTPDQVPVVLSSMVTILSAMNHHLQTVPVPAAQRADYRQMLTNWQTTVDDYATAVAAAKSGDTAGEQAALTAAGTANQQGNAAAVRLGLADCAGAGGLGDNRGINSAGWRRRSAGVPAAASRRSARRPPPRTTAIPVPAGSRA
jgi:hypothetical protein